MNGADAPHTALQHGAVLLLNRFEPADAAADDDAALAGILDGEVDPRIGDGAHRSGNRELGESVHPLGVAVIDAVLRGIERGALAAEVHGEGGGVPPLNRPDAAAAGPQRVDQFIYAVTQRRDETHAGDDDLFAIHGGLRE